MWEDRVGRLGTDLEKYLDALGERDRSFRAREENWNRAAKALVPLLNEMLGDAPGWKPVTEEDLAAILEGRAGDGRPSLVDVLDAVRRRDAARRDGEKTLRELPPDVLAGIIAAGFKPAAGGSGDPAAGGATVLVAQNGEVFIDHAFGIPAQERYMPRTTLPQFDLADIQKTFTELCAQLPPQPARGGRGAPDTIAVAAALAAGRGRGRGGPPPSPLQTCVTRVSGPIGAHQTAAVDSEHVQSSVDELYRFTLGLEVPTTWRNADYAKGWSIDTYKGVTRMAAYATGDGKRAALVRVPDRHATIVILTNDASADARGMAERILDQVLAQR
jgi:hypothetical protein